MNTTLVGDRLEEAIYDLLRAEIEADRFWAKKTCCRLFRKKGYHSKDRGSEIIIDVSIEIYLPGAIEYSSVVLVECKNYKHPVPVDDAEEFFSKVQQISGANVKAVIASTASFQAGTRNFSKSKGIGLLRYFDKSNFKWQLMRSPSASARVSGADIGSRVADGLSEQEFVSTVFDLYLQSPTRETNVLWDFFEDLMIEGILTPAQVRQVANTRSLSSRQIRYLKKEELEAQSAITLAEIGHISGEVSLDAICALERDKSGLKVFFDVSQSEESPYGQILGRIVFHPLQIHIFKQDEMNRGRERFTLAHELAHHLLNHSRYMTHEYSAESDFDSNRQNGIDGTDIARMEYQANYLAACMLMPLPDFKEDFRQAMRTLGLTDKGFGPMYVDNQSCNLQSFEFVAGRLMRNYGVSKSAVTIRLAGLGLLTDARPMNGLRRIQDVFVPVVR